MTKLAPEWVRTNDPVIRSPARYRWTTAPANFLDQINQWKIALRKPILTHNIERKKGEAANIIDPGVIVDYQKSPRAVEAKAMLLGYSKTAPLVITKDSHTLMRNYLIIQLMISNVSRAGGVINILTKDVDAGKLIVSRGHNMMENEMMVF